MLLHLDLQHFKYLVAKKLKALMKLFKQYFELTFWTTAMVFLALTPSSAVPHYSWCLFKIIGINFCPGCGLGHSINHLFHGNLQASFSSHPLGLFAVIIIICRIYRLLQLHIFSKTINNNYGIR